MERKRTDVAVSYSNSSALGLTVTNFGSEGRKVIGRKKCAIRRVFTLFSE